MEATESPRSLPVIVDNLLVTQPKLPPRTDLENKSPGDITSHSPSSASYQTETLHLSDIKTKLEPGNTLSAPRPVVKDNTSPNSLVDPYIINAKIETYGGVQSQPQQLTPPSKSNPSSAWSPNTVKVR